MSDSGQFDTNTATSTPEPGTLPSFEAPYDWPMIDQTVLTVGGVILKGLLDHSALEALNTDIDRYLDGHRGEGAAASGSEEYDLFLGHNTIRLHGLIAKVPSTAQLIGHRDLVDWAKRTIGDRCESVLLNAGELIQIQPGEPAQFPHRDSDSWPEVPLADNPVVVNAIVALDDCTLANGATYVVPESWSWDHKRQPTTSEWVRGVMTGGDALLFRGDLIHGGGANTSERHRRVLSISYCAGWLRPVENSFLSIPRDIAAKASATIQALLGYKAHDATRSSGGLIGLYENGDPALALRAGS